MTKSSLLASQPPHELNLMHKPLAQGSSLCSNHSELCSLKPSPSHLYLPADLVDVCRQLGSSHSAANMAAPSRRPDASGATDCSRCRHRSKLKMQSLLILRALSGGGRFGLRRSRRNGRSPECTAFSSPSTCRCTPSAQIQQVRRSCKQRCD